MEGGRQLRLLLWRDYLIRKRKFITLAGILWATAIMFGVYTVRINIDNQDFPTCQFAARALPSAGVLPFLQSFICGVSNECAAMDRYEDVPSYNNSKFSQLRGKLSPLLNASTLSLAASVPAAVKLLATVAEAADEPTFLDLIKNGLTVNDLFKNPARAQRYVTSRLHLDDDVAQSLMTAEISFQGMLSGDFELCSPDGLSRTLAVRSEHREQVSAALCALDGQGLQRLVVDLLPEINFSKYIKMLGSMYGRVSGDGRLAALAELAAAAPRAAAPGSYLPRELAALLGGSARAGDFSYFKLDLIPRFVELFAPTFGETEQYQSIRDLADAAVAAIQYMSRVFGKLDEETYDVDDGTNLAKGLDVDRVSRILENVEAVTVKNTVDPFAILSKLGNIIIKFLPNDKKHDLLFYSTLLAKLMESALKVIQINMHIKEITYNVTLRNPEAIEVLKGLDALVVSKAFEALVSPERTQILTSNINEPSQMFCDVSKLQKFLLISQAEAESVKKQLCSDVWKVFVEDLVRSFGVADVRTNINEMASLLIQETLGRDTSPQLFSVERALGVLRQFSSSLVMLAAEPGVARAAPGALLRLVEEKAHLGKLILISVHGALAKEIVKQNSILQYKITPVLLNINTFVAALNEQLKETPAYVSDGLKEVYGDVVRTVVMTANDDVKTYKAMSTYCRDILCFGGENAAKYLQFPEGVETDKLAEVMCNASVAIEAGLNSDSVVSKAIRKIMKAEHTALSVVKWTELINNIQNLYVHLDKNYPYLFEFSTYGMDNVTQDNVRKMCENAKDYWFAIRNLKRGVLLSLSLGFRLLDLLDYGIFNMTSETWLMMKFAATKAIGPLTVIDDTVKLVSGLLRNSTPESALLAGTALPAGTALAASELIPNLPQLIMDAVYLVNSDDTDIDPIISLMSASPPWPCSSASIADHLALTAPSKAAVVAMETLLCMDRSLRDEWTHYLDQNQIRFNWNSTYNTTQYAPQLFLRLSSRSTALAAAAGGLLAEAGALLAEDRLGLRAAVRYAADFAASAEGRDKLGKFFAKFDTVLDTIDTTSVDTDVSLSSLWEGYVACAGADIHAASAGAGCAARGRAVWRGALKVLAQIIESAATDMYTYFTEVNAPEHNILQVLGFTKGTALYSLYARLPEFVGVLAHSYWDYGFMSQIRRAIHTQFWDCEAVVSALVPPPGSPIQESDIRRVRPYVCPSLIYWLSLPRDDNVLFNIVAKPQYYFYSFHVKDSNGSLNRAFSKGMAFADLVTDISKQNQTSIADEISLESLKNKLTKFIDNILNYRLKETDEVYIQFTDISKKQFMSTVYLTRVVAILNKLATGISNITIDGDFITKQNIKDEDVSKLSADLLTMQNIFRRKAVDAISLHYDILTEVLWKDDDDYNIINAMDDMCHNINSNTSKAILVEEVRVKALICAKSYKVFYRAVHDTVVNDYKDARNSLINFVKVLQNGDVEITDIFDFFNNRSQLVASLKRSVSYSYSLGLPLYLQNLQTSLRSQRVLLALLAGADWWRALRGLLAGPRARELLNHVEGGFQVVDHFMNNLDGIHLVRLVRELRSNESRSFCAAGLALGEYLPDATGALAAVAQQLCAADVLPVIRELPPLLIAAQGYESSLKMSKDVDYVALGNDILYIESNISLISNGPKKPRMPDWVTEDKINLFRQNIINLLSKETLTKIVFGLMSNAIDAGTLFLDNSQCTHCSQMTTWFKQLNLQLFKKQEYDNLLCHLDTMSLDDIYYTLKNDFHWDMFIRELISSRNYTSLELNKSMTEFLDLAKAHLLDDMRAPTTKLAECLLANVTRNAFGNATLILQVLSHTARLLRAETPHLHKVTGIKELPFFKDLFSRVAHRLSVHRPLKEYLRDGFDLRRDLLQREVVVDDEVLMDLLEAHVDLLEAKSRGGDIAALVRLNTNRWEYICVDHDCGDIFAIISDNLNYAKIDNDLPSLQTTEYWQFSFVSSILGRAEAVLGHLARLVGAAGGVAGGAAGGAGGTRLAAMLDLLTRLLMDDTVDSILYSMDGLVWELQPLLQDGVLLADLRALAAGLRALRDFKTYLLEEADLSLKVSTYFPRADAVQAALTALGINNTRFWSLAAPRIHAGHLQLRPVLSSADREFHIARYVCSTAAAAEVLAPAPGALPAEEVAAATVDQFCSLDEDTVQQLALALLRNADYTAVIDKLKEHILSKLFSASELSEEQGAALLRRLPRLARALPALQAGLGGALADLKDEPLFQDLRDFSSVGNLLTSSEFLAHAGDMLCGAPFRGAGGRLVGNLLAAPDQAGGASQPQLDRLPTEFCRSMYRDIVGLPGGKVVWSFIKPLLMGKILYTPPAAPVHRIMHQANASFADMIQLSSLVNGLAAATPALDTLAARRAVLRRLGGPAARLLGAAPGDLDLEGMLQNVGDLKSISKLVSKASDLLRCFNLNRLVATANETTLMHEAAKLSALNEFSAGIVFMNEDKLSEDFSNIEYKIRMDIENVPTTTRKKSYLWTPGPEASFIENMRYFRGFVQIQDMVDKAIIQLSAQDPQTAEDAADNGQVFRRKRDAGGFKDLDWAVYTQQEPYPCYRKDYFQSTLYESQALVVCFTFALLFTVGSAVRFIVHDKETGNTGLMSVMGVDMRCHTLSWFLTSLCEVAATMACVLAVLRGGGVLPRSEPSLLLALLLLFGAAVLAYCYMMSKLFTSASFAAVCTSILYLISFMPFIVILSLESVISLTSKLLVCLSMSSAFSYGVLSITRLEAAGRGAAWRDVPRAPTAEDVSLAGVMAMLVLDSLLYLLIGWLIDRYNGTGSLRSNITTSAHEKAGVSLVNVCKTYGSGRRAKAALRDVSLELRRGQLTTLLGHNGAGKTTLTNILTGMTRPTSGHVAVRGAAPARVGVCPQRDVLLDCLTAREHLLLFAGLAEALPPDRLREEVDGMLDVLSLGGAASRRAARLSGGTRRRVCVALAFVARPALVSLDEPTAGVDPAARREIWDMIMRLKEDRTILLTTHHLDEAEILSDQIVIMHKGQVHTTGSPIEIMRSLGTGYRLSVTLAPPGGQEAAPGGPEAAAEALLAAVRQHVAGARVLAAGAAELEVMLPYHDQHGANNDFLQLCSTLEERRAALGVAGFALDCCSLEQVFCDIVRKADNEDIDEYIETEAPSMGSFPSAGSASSSSSAGALLGGSLPRRGARRRQLAALLRVYCLHLARNRSLLFMLVVLPTLFVTAAMAFSLLRPPIENEISLPLTETLYQGATEYLLSNPSKSSENIDPTFAQQVMDLLQTNKATKLWTEQDSPQCQCSEARQACAPANASAAPEMMILPDVATLNSWITDTHDLYIKKRYGGFSSALQNNKTNLILWYNNKGYHALPVYLNTLNNAILRAVAGADRNITTYSHPLKISKEQLSRDTLFQHAADAGVAALVVVALSAAAAGGAGARVAARADRRRALLRLAAAPPALLLAGDLLPDLAIMFVNMCLTGSMMLLFGLPVFVERDNLPAICLLIMLFGYACCSLVQTLERACRSPSLATMLLFCGNAFLGIAGITVLLILDIISDSDATDYARWVLHKVFMLSPQFALGDGLLEIAKNTIQAQVLYRFDMDTYRSPLRSDLLALHYAALAAVGTALLLLNLALEHGHLAPLLDRLRSAWSPGTAAAPRARAAPPADVAHERRRVLAALARPAQRPLSLHTIGNINRGFVHTEGKNNSLKRSVVTERDVVQCVGLSKAYPTRGLVVDDLTLGIPPGQCMALLGENGAGKSTTFSMLTGELRPTRGQIYLDGQPRDVRGLSRGLISYCPQVDAIDPLLTVREILQLFCDLRGIDDEEHVIPLTMQQFALARYGAVRSGALSGGNKRKLCAAIAFMGRSPLVLLDEPTSGMDPMTRGSVWRACARATGARRAVLLSTHALLDARRAAARVALLRAARLAACQPLADCLRRFGGGYVVACACADAAAAWRDVARRVPHAALRVQHRAALHFHIPLRATVEGKEVVTRLSDIFRVLAALQAAGAVRDYTVSRSSLEQMFLNNPEDDALAEDKISIEAVPSPHRTDNEHTVTSL